jgi:hypothetical protein
MPGDSLQDRLSGEPLPLEEITPILGRLAPALDYVHKFGIIHRDVKPANVFFDDERRAYLAEVGIARMAEVSQPTTGIIGTPAYMSPEQVIRTENRKIDGRADVYALGVMLYELLTGEQPYEAESSTQQMMAHVLEPVPDVLEANPELPPAAQDVIDKAMAKEPDERYTTAAELAAAVNALVGSDVATIAEAKAAKKDAGQVAFIVEPAPKLTVLNSEPEDEVELGGASAEPPAAVEAQVEPVLPISHTVATAPRTDQPVYRGAERNKTLVWIVTVLDKMMVLGMIVAVLLSLGVVAFGIFSSYGLVVVAIIGVIVVIVAAIQMRRQQPTAGTSPPNDRPVYRVAKQDKTPVWIETVLDKMMVLGLIVAVLLLLGVVVFGILSLF